MSAPKFVRSALLPIPKVRRRVFNEREREAFGEFNKRLREAADAFDARHKELDRKWGKLSFNKDCFRRDPTVQAATAAPVAVYGFVLTRKTRSGFLFWRKKTGFEKNEELFGPDAFLNHSRDLSFFRDDVAGVVGAYHSKVIPLHDALLRLEADLRTPADKISFLGKSLTRDEAEHVYREARYAARDHSNDKTCPRTLLALLHGFLNKELDDVRPDFHRDLKRFWEYSKGYDSWNGYRQLAAKTSGRKKK